MESPRLVPGCDDGTSTLKIAFPRSAPGRPAAGRFMIAGHVFMFEYWSDARWDSIPVDARPGDAERADSDDGYFRISRV